MRAALETLEERRLLANVAPVAVNDTFSTPIDNALIVVSPGLLNNDTDANGDPLTTVLVTNPSHGTLSLDVDGSFAYSPDAGYHGSDSFTYRVNDGTLNSGVATVTLIANTAPVANNDKFSTAEDTPLVVTASGILANDTDDDNDARTAVLITGPTHGTLTLNANGSFTYTPAANYNGSDSFTYAANDSLENSDPVTVTLTITAVNDAPSAVNDKYSTNEDAALTVNAPGILSNDTDVEGDALTAILVVGPSHGTLTLNANGSFTYTPAANYSGSDSFTYRASDGPANSAVTTVTLTVVAVNDAPVAADDKYSTNEDAALTVNSSGVLGNDTDIDGDALSTVLVSGPSHGTLTLNANGSFTYTPGTNYSGADSFTYRASDGQTTSGIATVTLTINAVNDAPVAGADGYSTSEDVALTVSAPGVLGNDSDIEGSALTALVVVNPAHGTLTLNSNGSFTYTPAANYNGTDTFTYKANDGQADSAAVVVTITITPVNDAPVAFDDAYSPNEDALLTVKAAGLLANDIDVDGNALSAVLVSGPGHGTLTLNANGSFTYTSSADYNGPDSFTYRVNNGVMNSAVATVTLTVKPVNDAPIAGDDKYSTNEDTALVVPVSGVLGNDSDVESGTLTAVLVTNVTHGALSLSSNGSFTYTPAANYNGTDTFTYKTNDGTVSGNTATVTITIASVNDIPVATADQYTTSEDTALTINAPGVLTNDTDADANALTAILVTGPAHGSLTLNANGSFTYTPAAHYNGSDSFTYKANDGQADSANATVNLTITAVNDLPVAGNESYSTNEDTPLTISAPGVLSNDTDADGSVLTAVLVAGPGHGTLTLNSNGSFTFTPAANFNGSDSFTYKANDGTASGNTATVTLTIASVNDIPVATGDQYTTSEDVGLTVNASGVLANDTDADANALTAILVTGPAHGSLTLNANGSFTYTPAANYNGSDSFTYKANDGQVDSAPATVTLTITAVNDLPVAGNDSYSTNEDTPLTISAPGVLSNDTDADGSALTAVLVTGPGHGTLTLSANGSFTYTPTVNYNGADTFTYKANDGTASGNTATVTITIASVNDIPVSTADQYTTSEDVALTTSAPGVLANDTDADGNALTAILVTGPAHGNLTLNSNGSFTYTPAANYNGSDSFTYKANDGLADSSPVTVTLTITAVNDLPVSGADSYSTNEDAPLTISAPGVLGNDADADGNALTAVLVTGPTHGTLTLGANGSFTYTPSANYKGSDSFTYRANDGTASGNTVTVSLTVASVNDAPVSLGDAYSTLKNVALNVDSAHGVLINDTDVDGDALTASLVSGPFHGTLSLQANGSFLYTPTANYSGADTFNYRANDGTANSSIATVNLTVGSVNTPPTAVNNQYTTAEDVALVVTSSGVLGNDTDTEGNALTSILVSGPAHGSLTLNANGSFTYTPAANYNGSDSFTYKANDGQADSPAATVTLTISAVNDAPVAIGDQYSTNEDGFILIGWPGTLVNDYDIDSGALTAVLVTAPLHGSLIFDADSAFLYMPFANYYGPDSFTYKANDGQADSAPATVDLTIFAVNDAPVAANDQYSTNEDTALTVNAAGLLGNDTDVDGNNLTAILVTGPSHGMLTLNANGSFIYNPAANFSGSDSFTYKATDGTSPGNVATVSLTIAAVNDSPICTNDQYSTAEDTPLAIGGTGVLGNDSDIDGGSLTAQLVSGPSHGTLTLNANGSFSYTPVANFNGTDSFTYKAFDGLASGNTASVNLTISAANDAPVSNSDSYSTNEDAPLTVPASGVLSNDSDIDGDAVTAVLVTAPVHGSLTLNANGSFTYTPAANYNGADTFTYKAADGVAFSNIVTVALTIAAVNDAPAAIADQFSTSEDLPLTISAPGVLGNDTDVDGDALNAILVSGPLHGTLTLNANGSFLYTPSPNFNGLDTFTYKANDTRADSATATVTITIAAVNDPPVSAADNYPGTKNVAVTADAAHGVLANDTDIDGNALTATLVAGPLHGVLALNANGSFTYTPNTNYSGSDTFTYTAGDGAAAGNIAIVTLNIADHNDAPISIDDKYTTSEDVALTITGPGVLGNDSDADGNALTAILLTGPSHGTATLSPNGSFIYTPSANFNGTDSFTYKASDGQANSAAATVTLSITAVNDAPAANDDKYSTNEDGPLVISGSGVLGNDSDVEGSSLSATIVANPAHGNLILNPNGSFTYTPHANYNGTDTFTYKAIDGIAAGNTATVTINILAVNDAPISAGDQFVTDQDIALTISSPGVLTNDTDIEGNSLTCVLVDGPTHGTLVLNANGSFTYTPDASFFGTDSFTYKASDGKADSAVSSVTITVNQVIPPDIAPVAMPDSYAGLRNATYDVGADEGVLGNDSDDDGDLLTVSLVEGPQHGTLTLNADGSFSYTPDFGFSGQDTFTYRSSDGALTSDATATIDVPPNQPPADPLPFTITRNPGSSVEISQEDFASYIGDPDGDALAIIITSAPAHGTATVSDNDTPEDPSDDFVTYIPNRDYFGADAFSYAISDQSDQPPTGDALITVQVNQVGLSPNPNNPDKSDLIVLGTPGKDKITLSKSGKYIKVVFNGVNKGLFAPTGRIIVDGGAANDTISAATLTQGVILYGGDGNDSLTGSRANSQLYGGAGNDTLVGHGARDLLSGGAGRNVISKNP